jgi:hypothetical protein
MSTSPSEPVENDQSGSNDGSDDRDGNDHRGDDKSGGEQGISDDQLPEDLQPGPDNPLASPEADVSEAPKPGEDDDAVPDGEQPPGEPSIG